MTSEFDQCGFQIIPGVIDDAAVASLCDAVANFEGVQGKSVRAKNERTYAVRNLLRLSPAVRRLADAPAIRSLIDPMLGSRARVVRAILFDKTAGANWKVAWHQDLSIAVKERIDIPGFGPWSTKAGVVHVQPPRELLERMVTLRLHLDDCGPANGPLQVLPGSHREGVLSPSQLRAWRERATPVSCVVAAGGVLLMRPLLLHASSAATTPGHRRVIHLEWSADELPGGLAWHEE